MLAKHILCAIENSSWIRKMFEAGAQLKQKLGAEHVFDFSLGNPCLEPPKELTQHWISHLKSSKQGKHSYTHNGGLLQTRAFLAKQLSLRHQLAFDEKSVLLCCGAGGGLNVVFHSLLNPKEQVLVSSPFFPEYSFYADNHNGVLKTASSKGDFQLNLEQIEKALTPKTKIFLLNSPNNPTGVVYSEDSIIKLCKLLQNYCRKNQQLIYLVSDEPYSRILFDNSKQASIFKHYKNSILVTSCSKDLSLAGERIGYIAICPNIAKKDLLMDGLIFSNRTLGFVNAPASLQYLLPQVFDLSVDYQYYKNLRDYLYEKLTTIGYKMIKPQGAFYLFPQALEQDDVAFVQKALDFGILLVPGSGFGARGYFRLSYAVQEKVAYNSIGAFAKLFDYYKTR
jgi:aspartate aminotransferase